MCAGGIQHALQLLFVLARRPIGIVSLPSLPSVASIVRNARRASLTIISIALARLPFVIEFVRDPAKIEAEVEFAFLPGTHHLQQCRTKRRKLSMSTCQGDPIVEVCECRLRCKRSFLASSSVTSRVAIIGTYPAALARRVEEAISLNGSIRNRRVPELVVANVGVSGSNALRRGHIAQGVSKFAQFSGDLRCNRIDQPTRVVRGADLVAAQVDHKDPSLRLVKAQRW